MGFFRYPGGKAKLKKKIISLLSTMANGEEYREPFFGGGSIGIDIMQSGRAHSVWINDKDIGVACLWTALIQDPESLKALVREFSPSIEAFDSFKEEMLVGGDPEMRGGFVAVGFRKLALHQISYSGLGAKSGGPLGGREQLSSYKIDCRWSVDYICKKIDKYHALFRGFDIRGGMCSHLDFEDVISDNSKDAIIYLDPPYYIKGNDLYLFGLSEEDHVRLARCLRDTGHKWVLSYDDCDFIRDLYGWAYIMEIDCVNYSITAIKDGGKKRKSRSKPELLIVPSEESSYGWLA